MGAGGALRPRRSQRDERLALLEFLTERGATIEQMVEAHQQGSLPAVASDIVVRGESPLVPVKEVAARSGIALDRVLRVLLSAGLPAEVDSEVPEQVIDLLSAFETGSELMGDEAILAFTRVLGAAAIQIAEATVALFYSELGPGTEREGQDELTRAKLAEAATLVFTAVPKVLAQMVMDQFERSLRRAVVVRGSWEPETGFAVRVGVHIAARDARRHDRARRARLRRPRRLDGVGRGTEPPGPEPGALPVRVGRLVVRRPPGRPCRQDDR